MRRNTTRDTLRVHRSITRVTVREHHSITRVMLREHHSIIKDTVKDHHSITRDTLRATMVERFNNLTMATSQQLIRTTVARLMSQKLALTDTQSAPTDRPK